MKKRFSLHTCLAVCLFLSLVALYPCLPAVHAEEGDAGTQKTVPESPPPAGMEHKGKERFGAINYL